ncbi:GH92 family glycosyl hydrolase [Zobellia galactanivorans]|uniref:GH92 family glycosyl hydrolase n=1 Tax=Zobellia galactanivorans (strain DSM 12802 / CCUG 47099 / CIP 106680 / NCIMB 13871 / Dsij) TaxID=63186 RepID=UPI0026E23E8C|nr:GH92 family glycosyl hydrolase [Zobellia galactanivorans]MDO6808172.1 GH92 family glycosyl hydrolase [Zobellia galactanivorans]
MNLFSKVSLYGICISLAVALSSCGAENQGPQTVEMVEPVDMVYPQLDTENSRWFFFSSASRPFGMVNLSPDTEVDGAWGSGYRYKVDTVQGFSHIHAWQLSGLSVMPVTIDDTNRKEIFTDFRSKFDHDKEKVSPGYHYLELEKYNINVELSSTTRVGLHKYAFPKKGKRRAVLFNLNGMLGPNKNTDGRLEIAGNGSLIGELLITETSRRPKPVKLFFAIDFNSGIDSIERDETTGNYLVFLKDGVDEVLMKAGISYTSVANAKANIDAELPHWDFYKVVQDSRKEWNGLLARIEVEGSTETARKRFYTDLWHGLQGRRIISDVNGAYPDNTGEEFRVGQLPLDDRGKPQFNHYNSDSFWGAQWTINTLWGLVYPEIMEEFVHSLLQYYKDGGMVPRGPSGGNYTYVMTGASSTPFVVSAIQKGLITEDLEGIYQALKKNHMLGGIMGKAGYEHHTTIGGGLKYYLENGYVPHPIPEGRFGGHQDGASMTMEYAYQDWTLAQLAKKLGYLEDYSYFMKRSDNYKNVFDASVGWMRPKDVSGKWRENYDPYEHENGFIESNGAQSTWFVPHDQEGLAALMGGKEAAAKKLNMQFEQAEKLGFTAGSSHSQELHPEYRNIPINYGNQPSIQTAFVFNKLDRPDLTQYWSRKVAQTVFGGLSPATGYNGDEDQGLMGSLAVLMKIGLFQMNGGTEENPKYEFGSPSFDKVVINLTNGNKLTINAKGASSGKVYVNGIQLNGEEYNAYSVSHDLLEKGAVLDFNMVGHRPELD